MPHRSTFTEHSSSGDADPIARVGKRKTQTSRTAYLLGMSRIECRYFQAACLLAATAGVAAIGCTPTRGPTADSFRDTGTEAWRPSAVAIRIHPATQYRMLNETPVLEVRIELTDTMGDPIKASASYRFDLALEGVSDIDSRFYQWDERVMTEADHRERYDAVTRSYVFPLTLGNFDAAEHPTRLSARVELANGEVLEASAPVVAADRR